MTTKKSTKKAAKKGAKRKLTPKQEHFKEGVIRHNNATRAAREAGYAHPNKQGPRLLVNVGISEAVERRRAEARRRAQIHTDEIVGMLAEIATASITDVLEDDGSFDPIKCRGRGTDHLLREIDVTERKSRDGSSRTTYKYKMYSRLDALGQLRENFGMKQEPRPNSATEVESAIQDFIRKAKEKGYDVPYEEAKTFVEPRMVSEAIN